jgi:hypothetical protein
MMHRFLQALQKPSLPGPALLRTYMATFFMLPAGIAKTIVAGS